MIKAKILSTLKQTIKGTDITIDGWYDPDINNMRVLFIIGVPAIAVNVDTGYVANVSADHCWYEHNFIHCPEFKIEL